MTNATLLSVLDGLERPSLLALIRFNDGDIDELRVISTMHAEEGGDVVAEVVRVVLSPKGGAQPNGTFINFFLVDVVQVTIAGVCVFSSAPDAS